VRQALVIARREIAEKRFVLFAALAFAVLPFVIAAIPIAPGSAGPRDVMDVAAGLLCVGFTLALALILGANVIGRDLSENRLSFYFSRPVGAASIWFGKMLGALALIAFSFAMILGPARILGASRWAQAWAGDADRLALNILGLAVVLFFAAHVLSTFVRSRSAWIALDFVLACVAAIAAFAMIVALGGQPPVTILRLILAGGVVVGLIGGGAWQLARGRTDRKRSHRALSQFLWTTIAATLLVAGGFMGWLMSAAPNDLKDVMVSVARPGGWVILGGEARGRAGYRAAFVYNLASGAWTRMPGGSLWRAGITEDGKTLVFCRVQRGGSMEIVERPVGGGAERFTGLTLPLPAEYVTDATGDRIAAVDGAVVSIYDVPRRRTLFAARVPESKRGYPMYFQSPALVRIIIGDEVYDLDAAHRTMQRAMRLPGTLISANGDGSKFLVRDEHGRVLVVGAQGVEATIASANAAVFLHDDRIATTFASFLQIWDGGKLVRTIRLPELDTWRIRETRDGRLLIPGRVIGKRWETLIVDPQSGAMQRIPATALSFETWWRDDPRRTPLETPQYFFDNGRIVRWNFATNRGEPVVPKG